MIEVLKYTEEPLSFMGKVASICWHSKPSEQIGIDCMKSNHGRVMEYADVVLSISGYSDRMIRELYTQIIGVSRLQSSTRYISYKNMEFYTPATIGLDKKALEAYERCMDEIKDTYGELLSYGIPKEDIANILPLGMKSEVVLKINLRAIMHLFELRTCARVLCEFRNFMDELDTILYNLDDEWEFIMENFMYTKCIKQGFCNEKKGCGFDKTDDFKEMHELYREFISS